MLIWTNIKIKIDYRMNHVLQCRGMKIWFCIVCKKYNLKVVWCTLSRIWHCFEPQFSNEKSQPLNEKIFTMCNC